MSFWQLFLGSYVLALAKNLYEKRSHKTLMKLTARCIFWYEEKHIIRSGDNPFKNLVLK